jgi:hypothetical protein
MVEDLMKLYIDMEERICTENRDCNQLQLGDTQSKKEKKLNEHYFVRYAITVQYTQNHDQCIYFKKIPLVTQQMGKKDVFIAYE